MQVQAQPVHQSWITYAITIGIIVVIMALRMRGMSKMRPLKLGSLWIVPVAYLVVAALMFIQLPPTGWVAIASVVGLAIGAAVGWQRGKMMEIHVDPQTHALNQKASPAAIFFLIALIVVRSGAKLPWAVGRDQSCHAHRSLDRLRAWHVHPHAPRNVSAREAVAGGGAWRRFMSGERFYEEPLGADRRCSAPAALRNREPIAEVLA